jgi:uncharacterized protein involved in exopolysaccharide biosynthesis/Mrp family chromosome partitioning ATPase
MNDKRPIEQSGGMTLGDIYFVLFRHKWKIILFSLAGILAAVGIYLFQPPLYQSEARVLIKYIMDDRPGAVGGAPKLTSPEGSAGEFILNSELDTLTSLDLAKQVVTSLGATNVLAKWGGGTNADRAAALIRANLIPESPKKSMVIRVLFQHPDPAVVQPVLTELINDYLVKHRAIHRMGSQYVDAMVEEKSSVANELQHAEENLTAEKLKVGVTSLEDARRANHEEISKIHGALITLGAELKERQAFLNELTKSLPKPETTNTASAPETPVPAETIADYKSLRDKLDGLKEKRKKLRDQGFSETGKPVDEYNQRIAETDKEKARLEEKYPALVTLGISLAKSAENQAQSGPALDLTARAATIVGLQAQTNFLNSELQQLMLEATNLAASEPKIKRLETEEQQLRTNYLALAFSVQQTKNEEELESAKIFNIIVVQQPTPPFRDFTKTNKVMAMAGFGGIALGLALAFLMELYLDRSVKRPKEVEARLGLRLFLSIPDITRNGHRQLAKSAAANRLRLNNGDASAPPQTSITLPQRVDGLDVALWDPNHALHPYYEALKDRLVGYFEVRNLTHKPKLVAVTGAGRGSGATTMAVGLAASLSETGDGNVLLVDMNLEHGAAQQFFKGKPGCGLDEALTQDTRDSAMVQDNLYVVSGGSNGDKLPRILPKRFASLLPKLKASDFDYIIFDMPPISETSVTLRLAGYMDMVMLVVESEKTDRELVQRASSLLAESKANVSVLLNKTRRYVPASLQQEF